MIILQLHLKLNIKRNKEKVKKYQLLSKCFKDYLALAQVKAGNTSENLLNEIRQIIYFLYQGKEVTKKVYNNITENSKTADTSRLLLSLIDKINLKKSNKYVALSNLSIYYTWKNVKKSYKNNKFKISATTWNEEFVLPDGSYSVSDMQDYFEHILKKT